MQKPPKLVPALVSGIAILRLISQSNEPLRVAQISQSLGLNPSTCFNILKTFTYLGWLRFDPVAKHYSLALGVLEVASSLLSHGAIPLIRPYMEEVSRTYGVTVLLWQRTSAYRLTLVDKAEPMDAAIRVQLVIGQRFPALIGAIGRSFAASIGMDRAGLQEQFRTLRWQDAPTFEEYWQGVENARQLGYGIDRENFQIGVNGIGVMINGRSGVPSMGLSTIWVGNRFSEAQFTAIGTRLRQLAAELTHNGAVPDYEDRG